MPLSFGLVPKYDVGSTFWSHTSTHYACRRDRNGSDHSACCLDRSFKTIKALNPRSGSPISIYGSLHTPQHTPPELVLTGASSGLCVLYSICSRSLAFTASVCNRMSASLRFHFAIEHISIPICFVMVRAIALEPTTLFKAAIWNDRALFRVWQAEAGVVLVAAHTRWTNTSVRLGCAVEGVQRHQRIGSKLGCVQTRADIKSSCCHPLSPCMSCLALYVVVI